MKHVGRHIRRPLFCIEALIVLLGTMTVTSWRVGAQEARPGAAQATITTTLQDRPISEVLKLSYAQPDDVVAVIREKYRDLLGPQEKAAAKNQDSKAPKYKGLLRVAVLGRPGSIVVSAPRPLLEEIQIVVRELDENAAREMEDAETYSGKPREQTWGHLKGRFIYNGEPPVPTKLRITKNIHAFAEANLVDESLVVADDGALANVVVWVRNKDVAIHSSYGGLKSLEADIQTFQGRLEPHVISYWTGQPLKLRNFDSVTHNLNASCSVNEAFNVIISPKSSVDRPPLKNGEPIPFAVADNIHSWIRGWMVVQPHPYVAISEADGRFEIKNLPAGVPLEFQVWQETSGYVQMAQINGKDAGWVKGRFTITLKPDETMDFGDIKLDPAQFRHAATQQALTDAPLWNKPAPPAANFPPPVKVLAFGDRMKLDARSTKFSIPAVGQLEVEGPAELELVDANCLKIEHGRVKLRITEETGRSFVIETPHGRVAELGTESTVSVDQDGKAAVVIRDGKVDLVTAQRGNNPIGKTDLQPVKN